MATVQLTDEWKNITSDQSLADGSDYSGQARTCDIEYDTFADSVTAPDESHVGWIMKRDDRPATYSQVAGKNLWARANRNSIPGNQAILKIE